MAESVDSLQGFNTYVLLMWLCVPQSFQCMKLYCGSYILCRLLVIPSCNITFHIIDIVIIIIIFIITIIINIITIISLLLVYFLSPL